MNQRLCAILPLLALLFVASLNRVTAVTLQGTNGTFGSLGYGYDTVHRRTYMQVDASLGDVFAYDDTDQVTGVQYDATNPDTTPSSPVRTVSYGFDPVGNRTNVTDNGSGTSYTANNLNQYTAVGGASPTYDGNGNLTNYNGWGYAYDAQNRLWGAANSNTTGLFTYDARNRVVSRVVNGTTNYYFYDDWNLVSDRDAAGNALQTYVHGPRIDELIFKTDGSNVVYYHHDALGNVTHLTDSYSRVVERYRYDIYGQATIKDGNGNPLSGTAYGNRFQFTGREYLADFGLHDYRNRVYLQSWGRFIQTDPIRFDANDINIYRYCSNDSINRIDPDGRKASMLGILKGAREYNAKMAVRLNSWKDGAKAAHEGAVAVAERIGDALHDVMFLGNDAYGMYDFHQDGPIADGSWANDFHNNSMDYYAHTASGDTAMADLDAIALATNIMDITGDYFAMYTVLNYLLD